MKINKCVCVDCFLSTNHKAFIDFLLMNYDLELINHNLYIIKEELNLNGAKKNLNIKLNSVKYLDFFKVNIITFLDCLT